VISGSDALLKAMKVLVIGSSGFIGTNIVRLLAEHGHVVAIYHRGQTHAALPCGVHHILHPRSVMPSQKSPKKLFEFGPEVVVHTLAMGAD
jgi:nucleoside-diphosphate-sugar epimerase